MRSALQNARDHGVGLFFTGSNAIYWKIRFENGPSGGANRVEVTYKTVERGATDPVSSTSTWRDPAGPNNPENALVGEMYVGDNDNQSFPLVIPASMNGDRVYRFTTFQGSPTSTTLGSGIVGWEWHARVNNGSEPARVITLASWPDSGELTLN